MRSSTTAKLAYPGSHVHDPNQPEARRRTVVHTAEIESPVGPILLGATDQALVVVEFVDRQRLPAQLTRVAKSLDCVFAPGETPLVEKVRGELDDYFCGRRKIFEVPVGMTGTPFQVSVWKALLTIPHGETRSYTEVAAAIGRTDAVRAVARANGDNRLAIVIPCHRVIGADGRLVGYGGGLWRKERLLDLERGLERGSAGRLF